MQDRTCYPPYLADGIQLWFCASKRVFVRADASDTSIGVHAGGCGGDGMA